MDRERERGRHRVSSSPSITATSCSNSMLCPSRGIRGNGLTDYNYVQQTPPSSTVRRWAFPWRPSPTPTAPPIRPWWLTSAAIPRTIPTAPRPGTTASNRSLPRACRTVKSRQGSIAPNLQFAASGRQRGAVCGRPRAIDRSPVAHGQPVDLELAEHHSHPVPLTSSQESDSRWIRDAASSPRCPPAASRPSIQVGSGLHCLPAGPAGRRARSAGADGGPGRPLAGTQEDGARAARDYLPRDQVASPSGSLQEILAHPDIIPTHHHPLLGRQAPDFELADPEGKVWNLRELLDGRPVVLIFYYGYHCVACVRQLFDVNRDLPLFREVGARVVAISADPPELTRRRFQQYGPFGFPVLSDPGNKVAQAYRVFRRRRTERWRTSSAMGLLSSTGMARFSGSMLAMRRSVAIRRCSTNWPRWKAVCRR